MRFMSCNNEQMRVIRYMRRKLAFVIIAIIINEIVQRFSYVRNFNFRLRLCFNVFERDLIYWYRTYSAKYYI